MTSKKKFGILAGLLCLWMCCGCLGLPVIGEPIIILFGWVPFLKRTVPEMYIEPTAVAVGLAALVGFAAALHSMAAWLYGHKQTEDAPRRPWRARWTLAITGIVFCVFAAAIATLVIVHEVGWLATAKEPLYTSTMRMAVRRADSLNKMKQLVLAMHNYHDTHDGFPAGGTFTEDGQGLHSWATPILGHVEVTPAKPPCPDLPWNDAANARFFKRRFGQFLNPGVADEGIDENGFGLSHYATNVHVLGPNRRTTIKDMKDGTANTIMLGEVNAGFKPWGDPTNYRDPAKGFGDTPEQFGSPWPSVVNMGFGDGNARSISKDIDPAVLKALATPAGGEKLPEDWGY